MIVEIAAANIMKHGIKHYSFGQASKFVFVTLVTGTEHAEGIVAFFEC